MNEHPELSFMSANFLGRERNYVGVRGFGESRHSIAEAFSPAATYEDRIGKLFDEIAALGFRAVDLWTAHCNPEWATPRHFKGLRAAARRSGIVISSLAGGMGGDLEAFEKICRLAHEAETTLLGISGGLLTEEREGVSRLLEKYRLKLGFENHPNEKTPADVLARIGNGCDPALGVTLDTGWFATHGYPVVAAIEELQERLFLVHLKNIRAPGGHEAAPWDEGCLDMEPIVRKLASIGYRGTLSLEYEPLDHNPAASCRAFREKIGQWLSDLSYL